MPLRSEGAPIRLMLTFFVMRRLSARWSEVCRLLRWTSAHVRDEYGVSLIVRRLPRPLRHQVRLGTLWQALARAISPSSVAVLGLAGRQSHWTVAIGVTPRQIKLFDSCKMRVLHRRHCRAGRANLRNGISAPCVFIIKRRQSSGARTDHEK